MQTDPVSAAAVADAMAPCEAAPLEQPDHTSLAFDDQPPPAHADAFDLSIDAALSEPVIEQKIRDKGLTAPRVTPSQISETILAEQFHVFPGTTVTVCCLTLRNGFTVVGESACASPENFDTQLGREIAHKNAREKIWALEGYLLRDKLHRAAVVNQQLENSFHG